MKPIRLTNELIERLRGELFDEIVKELDPATLAKAANESLAKLKMSDGSFSFNRTFKFERKFVSDEKRRVRLLISPVAFTKISFLLATNNKEVGWHATSERLSDSEFMVKDVIVYPQQVTAATVDTDQQEYDNWMNSLDDDVFNNMHTHMHSHVNMGVFASSVDLDHRQKIISQMRDNDYYIFMIWNKAMSWSAAIYDMPTNTMYETSDIDIVFLFGDGTSSETLAKEVKEKVTDEKPFSTTSGKDEKKSQADPVSRVSQFWDETGKGVKGDLETGNGLGDFRGGYQYPDYIPRTYFPPRSTYPYRD